MRAIAATTTVELKLFLRDPAAAFFTLLLPVLLLVLSGSQAEAQGQGIASFVPALVAYVIATTGIAALPATVAGEREKGVLRRFRATPVRPSVLLTAHLAVGALVVVAGLALLAVLGAVLFGLEAPRSLGQTAVALALSTLALFALGLLLAAVLPRARTAEAVSNALYFPMIFLSGAVWPRDALPEAAARVGDWLPLTYAVRALQGAWTQDGADPTALGVLAAVLVLSAAGAIRLFRWD